MLKYTTFHYLTNFQIIIFLFLILKLKDQFQRERGKKKGWTIARSWQFTWLYLCFFSSSLLKCEEFTCRKPGALRQTEVCTSLILRCPCWMTTARVTLFSSIGLNVSVRFMYIEQCVIIIRNFSPSMMPKKATAVKTMASPIISPNGRKLYANVEKLLDFRCYCQEFSLLGKHRLPDIQAILFGNYKNFIFEEGKLQLSWHLTLNCSPVPSLGMGTDVTALWTSQTHACRKSSKCFSKQKDPPTSYRCESPSQPVFPFSVWHPSFGWLNDMNRKQRKILLHRNPTRISLCICRGLGNTWNGPNCLRLPTW